MLALELSKGTGSIGRAFEKLGWGVVSVDINPKFKPTIAVDILVWDYTCFPKDYFQLVWASPCCIHYSKARTTGGPRDLEGADKLVSKTLEIIAYFGCNWAFENPDFGLLKTREFDKDLPSVVTSYCRYGYSYRKNTRIWSCMAMSLHQPCTLKNPCDSMIGRRHPKTAQQSRRGSDKNDTNNRCSQKELYSIPEALCDTIAEAANLALLETQDNVVASPLEGTDAPTPESFIPEVI